MRQAMLVAVTAAVTMGAWVQAASAADAVYNEGGLVKVTPYPVEAKFRNQPWPADLEKGFWERANNAIRFWKGKGGGGITGEHEKWTYPKTMLDFLATGDRSKLGILEAKDGEQPQTLGVDLYWCFTLKGQMRKYFWFGEHAGLISKDHLDLMRRAAKIWTSEDPRPTMELVLALESQYPGVHDHALRLLKEMRGVSLQEAASLATNDEAKQAILDFAKTPLAKEDFDDDLAKWRAWWAFFADRDWKVFEEYERVINPRPHPEYGVGTGPVGATWDPKTRGGWVDARNTDNLRSMRETSVYLMAEAVGNEPVRQLYKEKLRRFVVGLYTVGMGEWDSENYHAHTIMPWLNCYDFAKDPEVKMMAKAALDWLSSAAALKYYRGGYGGPTKRDYGGGNVVFGAGASHLMYLWFGDSPQADPDPEEDMIHPITSAYRPPLATVGLARKAFEPVEMLNTKPTYSHWLPGASDSPEFWETMYFGKTYYLGTVASKTGSGDVGPFKMLAYNAQRGVDFVVAWSGGRYNTKRAGDQIAQYRNMVVELRPDADRFSLMLPKTAEVDASGKVWFAKLERTWLAIFPINLGPADVAGFKGKGSDKYGGDQILSAEGTGGYGGLAIEVGEGGSFDAFKQAVLAKAKLDLSGIRDGKVAFTGSEGRKMDVTYNLENDLPVLVRDGKPREWSKEFDLYRPVGSDAPMSLGWKDGTLTVTAGGHSFTETVTKDGKVTFSEK